jgi:hypothetical protein
MTKLIFFTTLILSFNAHSLSCTGPVNQKYEINKALHDSLDFENLTISIEFLDNYKTIHFDTTDQLRATNAKTYSCQKNNQIITCAKKVTYTSNLGDIDTKTGSRHESTANTEYNMEIIYNMFSKNLTFTHLVNSKVTDPKNIQSLEEVNGDLHCQ